MKKSSLRTIRDKAVRYIKTLRALILIRRWKQYMNAVTFGGILKPGTSFAKQYKAARRWQERIFVSPPIYIPAHNWTQPNKLMSCDICNRLATSAIYEKAEIYSRQGLPLIGPVVVDRFVCGMKYRCDLHYEFQKR